MLRTRGPENRRAENTGGVTGDAHWTSRAGTMGGAWGGDEKEGELK